MSRNVNEIDWTDEKVERLGQMCADGYTSGQIAKAWNVSRSAICGKIKRLKPKRGEPSDLVKLAPTLAQPAPKSRAKPRSEWKTRSPRAPKPEPASPTPVQEPSPVPEVKAAAAPNPTRLIDATHNQCRWILEEHAEPTVCGAAGHPWCPTHRARVYSASGPRKELVAA